MKRDNEFQNRWHFRFHKNCRGKTSLVAVQLFCEKASSHPTPPSWTASPHTTLTYLLYSASGAFHSIPLLSNLFLPSLPLSHLHLGQLFKQCLRLYQMLLIKGFTFSGGCTQTFYVISLNASLPTTSGWQQQVIKRKKRK